jgi:hypothetical protein
MMTFLMFLRLVRLCPFVSCPLESSDGYPATKTALPNSGNQERKAGFDNVMAKIERSCLKSKGYTKAGVSPVKRRGNIEEDGIIA